MSFAMSLDSVTSDVQSPLLHHGYAASWAPVNDWSPPLVDLDILAWLARWKEHSGEPYQHGSEAPPAIAVCTSRRRYQDPNGNKIVVSLNSSQVVLLVFHYSNTRLPFLTGWMPIALSWACSYVGSMFLFL